MSLYNRFLVFCIFALFIMVTFTGPVFAAVNPTYYSSSQSATYQQKYVVDADIIAGIHSVNAANKTIEYTVEPDARSLPFYMDHSTTIKDYYWFSNYPAKFWNAYKGCAQVGARGTPLTAVYDGGSSGPYLCGYSPAPAQSSCELAVLLSSPDRPIINSGGDLFVSWSVSEVSSDICYDSCLYDKSTATVSTCYQSDGQTTVGYCNFGVSSALDENNQPSTCSSSNDYSASKIGTTPVGGGDTGGGDTGGGDTGGGDTGGGGDGSGGDVFVTGGELDFFSSGDVFVDPDLALEIEETKFDSFLQGALSDTLGGDEFGEFKSSLLTYSTRGSCPALSFDFLGVPIYSDTHCVLFEDVRGLLSLIFMAAWTFLGIRIALSA